MKTPQSPLAGKRVLDLTNVLAGPFCCHQLAHLGAEVIKIEAVGKGDLARELGADVALNEAKMGVSFLAQNAGKKSITLNLKSEAGKKIFRQLVKTADVLVENFRPGVMERLGLDYENLQPDNSRLIYCAISGFGQDGPWAKNPAYDQIIQGLSGIMSVTGEPGGTPLRAGYPACDTIGGLCAAFAIAAALNNPKTGVFIDISMLEASLASMGWVVSNYLVAGQEPQARGNENPTSAPSGAFQTASGLINIAANKDEQWLLLLEELGRTELAAHPDYVTRQLRKQNRLALKTELEISLKTKSAKQWAAALNAVGVPAGPVLTVPEILSEPQITDRGLYADFEDIPGVDRNIRLARVPMKINGKVPAVASPPPRLGEHTIELLGELGIGAGELDELQQEGVI